MFKHRIVLILLLFSIVVSNCCEVGWFPYKKNKCIIIFETLSTYDESVEYCGTAMDAKLLSISSINEKKFWTFYLFRYLNITENVWLQPFGNNTIKLFTIENNEIIEKREKCLAMKSLKGAENEMSKVGDIFEHNCYLFGSTVCETLSKDKPLKPTQILKSNPNSEFIPNRKIKLLNGNESEIFTGLYYKIISKYNNQELMDEMIGNGKCISGQRYEFGECETYYKDNNTDPNPYTRKLHMFSQSQIEDNIRIRRFSSNKQIVSFSKQGLQTFECYKDGYQSSRCDNSLKMYKMNALWKLESTDFEGFYKIRPNNENSAIGVTEFRNKSITSTAFALFNQINSVNNKILFRIEPQNYTFNVQLYSIEWDHSLEDIIALNRKQISLMDTAIINNNSPANLNHEVSTEKTLSQSFKTSFGSSTKFLESFSSRKDNSITNSQSKSSSNSFTDSASEAISSSLTQSLSTMSSSTSTSGSSTSHGGDGGSSFDFLGIFSIEGSYRGNTENHQSNQNTRSSSYDRSQSSGTTHQTESSNTKTNENTNSISNSESISKDQTQGKEETKEKSEQISNSQTRTYRISKIVTLPPYSAVKISSFANWVNDMTVPFKLNIKFTANSWRRRTDGKGTNEWRTLDAEVVEYMMKSDGFPGKIISKSFDEVIGQITGSLTASVGLESVFSSKEINLDEEN